MGLKHRKPTRIYLPLRVDLLCKDLCCCVCHVANESNPHKGNHCGCNPQYRVDAPASSVVQLEQEGVT